MIRKIIKIDEEKCTGCGICAEACHEGAIDIVDGKAKLVREHFCDGLGDCLPQCPVGAITFEEREAPEYDENAVVEAKHNAARRAAAQSGRISRPQAVSQLRQWPCQIKLVPPRAPFFDGADLLVAADCTAYARATVHDEFMRGKVTLIGCPKLDGVDYSVKLREIAKLNSVASVTVLRMEVPCCGGLEAAVKRAFECVPVRVVTVSVNGEIVGDKFFA